MRLTHLRLLKMLANISAVLCCVCLGWGLSFYFRDLPTSPHPELGSIYPLNKHGLITYMTRRELLEHELLLPLSSLFFVVFFVVRLFNQSLERRHGGWLDKP